MTITRMTPDRPLPGPERSPLRPQSPVAPRGPRANGPSLTAAPAPLPQAAPRVLSGPCLSPFAGESSFVDAPRPYAGGTLFRPDAEMMTRLQQARPAPTQPAHPSEPAAQLPSRSPSGPALK
jgi:hypothetical protein